MRYHTLHELIQNSPSSRSFFLSLPVPTQCRLHEEYNVYVHSAAELHRAVYAIETLNRQKSLGGWR